MQIESDGLFKNQEFEFYIGDNEDFTLNNKVPGGPHLKEGKTETVYDARSDDPDYWPYGLELFVNLEGLYFHIV